MQPTQTTANKASAVVPLLQRLNQVEELTAAIAMRLDPITNHVPSSQPTDYAPTVTGRLTGVADTLQYLLDNIEL